MNFIKKACIVTICSALASTTVHAGSIYEVTDDGVNIRSGPGTGTSYKCCDDPLNRNMGTVYITEITENQGRKWGRVSNGWVCLDFAKPTAQRFKNVAYTVEQGYTLSGMMRDIAGIRYKANLDWILELNPNIKNIHALSIGQSVILPIKCDEIEEESQEKNRELENQSEDSKNQDQDTQVDKSEGTEESKEENKEESQKQNEHSEEDDEKEDYGDEEEDEDLFIILFGNPNIEEGSEEEAQG